LHGVETDVFDPLAGEVDLFDADCKPMGVLESEENIYSKSLITLNPKLLI